MLNTARGRLYAFAASAVVIALFVVFGSLALSANYNYCIGNNGQHYTQEHDEKGSPIVEGPIENPTAVRLFVYCSGVYANENGAGITALATVLLTVVTLGLVWLGFMQYSTTRTQLRAYVGVDSGGVYENQAFPDWPFVNMALKNTGQTPARNVRNWFRLDVGPITGANLAAVDTTMDVAGSNIAAGGTTVHREVYLSRQLAANEITAIQGRIQAIYLLGVIKYLDVFGRERTTTYRLYHTGSWPPIAGSILLFDKTDNSFT